MCRVKLIGSFCKDFRVNILQVTLNKISEETRTNIKTLSAFECGRSNNMEHVFKYVDYCDSVQKIVFTNGLSEIVRGDLC